MSTYELDTLIQLTGTFTAADGVTLVDPTDVFLFLRTPNGLVTQYTTSTTPAITRVSVGVYQIELETTQAGPWIYKWQGTGAVEVTTPDVYITVLPSAVLPG